MAKLSMSDVVSKAKSEAEIKEEKQKQVIHCGVDTDRSSMQITIPLVLKASDLRVKETENNGNKRLSFNAACVFRTSPELEIAVIMDDPTKPNYGEIRHFRVRQNAGPYGPDRFINLGGDPTEFYTVPGETPADLGVTMPELAAEAAG